jgi:hypothetical protein
VCCRHGSVDIMTGYGLKGMGSTPGRSREFSLIDRIHTDSGAYPGFYPMRTAKAAGT